MGSDATNVTLVISMSFNDILPPQRVPFPRVFPITLGISNSFQKRVKFLLLSLSATFLGVPTHFTLNTFFTCFNHDNIKHSHRLTLVWAHCCHDTKFKCSRFLAQKHRENFYPTTAANNNYSGQRHLQELLCRAVFPPVPRAVCMIYQDRCCAPCVAGTHSKLTG